MHRKEVNLASPLRILDRWIRGGLGRGHLGVIAGPPGVGKSACLVHVGVDALMRDRAVLHVALGQSVDHVSARYDALFDDLAERVHLKDRGGVRESMAHRRLIWSLAEGGFGARALDEALAAFERHLGLRPSAVLVDGFAWEAPGCAATVAALKESAARAGAELWMTARDGRGPGGAAHAAAPPGCAELVDVGLSLAPHGRHARLTLVKDHERAPAEDASLLLEARTLRLLRPDEAAASAELDPAGFTLVAAGSAGAEEEFGACAERWGVGEVNFSFAGRREVARTRGLVELGEEELRLGEVSDAYVKAHLHRSFQDAAGTRRVLEAIWHQVSTSGEVFFVGTIRGDGTAHGGTGWAVELARHWGKPVHVFDEARSGWFRWDGAGWSAEAPPAITRPRFAGSGTRHLSGEGREAIRALFERTFGAADAGR
jgi:hypothetical protein